MTTDVHPDRTRWNEKYRQIPADLKPASLVRSWFHVSGNARALDLAAGVGGNALFLARKGFSVDAVDISDAAVKHLQGLHPDIRPIQADLASFFLPRERYGLILNFHYLERSLFDRIANALTPGGVLLFETHLQTDILDVNGPSNPEYLLQPNELLRAFSSLHVLYYREGFRRQGDSRHCLASLAAQKSR